MPRIRTLKPEHKSHRKVGPLSDRAYRLWVGMITEADDEGRLVAEPAQLRVVVFAYHPHVRLPHIEGALRELELVGLIRRYLVDGVVYADFPSWKDHQRIDRERPSKLPPCDASSSIRRALDDQSSTPRGGSRIKEGIKEGIKDERAGGLVEATAPAARTLPLDLAPDIEAALNRCAVLGQARSLRNPVWWLAEIRAHRTEGIDYPAELLRAEAWITTNPQRAPRKDFPRFMHSWLGRVEGRNGHGA